MIRKLIAAGSVLAVAVVALMVMTVGSGAKSAEAHVQSISGPAFISPTAIGVAEINVVAEDGHGDVRITASAGAFAFCSYQDGLPCETYDEVTSVFPGFLWSQATICDEVSAPDCAVGGDVDFIQLLWGMAEGFPGGAVFFTACQADQTCPAQARAFTMQVGGAPAAIEVHAMREFSSSESSSCEGTPVYVIAGVEYSFNNLTTFNNNRAVICAEVRDSVGHALAAENVQFTVTGGGCFENGSTLIVATTDSRGIAYARLESCGTGNSGDVATVTASAGVTSNAVTVEFGGDPAACAIPDFLPDMLDVGDTADFTATFEDELGNKVPDGIIAHIEEVDSGDGGDNVDVVSELEDTVNSQVSGSVIGAIAGNATIAVSLETIAGADPTCSEALVLSGDIHQHPDVCEEDEDFILYGHVPPGGNFEWGTFAFCGGSWDKLLEVSGCDEDTAIFWYNTPAGGWESWVPGADVDAVNAAIMARWPDEHGGIPHGTIFTAACSAIDD